MDTISLERQDLAPRTITCDSEGQISGSAWSVILFEGVFGLGLLAVSLSTLMRIAGRGLLEWAAVLPFVAMFGVAAYWLLRDAAWTIRQRRYAWGATLELSGEPPAAGGRLTGVIRHPKLGTFDEFDLVWLCLRGGDESRPAPSATFNPAGAIWFEQQRAKVVHDAAGDALPVSFPIPHASSGVFGPWRLEARPALPGVILFFEIPVFQP